MTWLIAGVAGAVGAVLRHLLSGSVQRRSGTSLPVGTASVNLLGAFALGVVVGTGHGGWAWTTAAAVTGGFTTFSTWMVETAALGVVPRPSLRAALNLFGMAGLGLVAAALGYSLTN